ncbi:MAG: hypothetical protein CL661_12275 [Bacteroidetes bacterium]|jgi:hypothetical protein|nr:hypothetical protein [Bacteroidota bacterium]|tara:strand:+ start:275 stop:712 length:438 start_codon:yes stop_codon:yes gene_type:complete
MKKIIISITLFLTIGVSIFAKNPIFSAKTIKCKWIEGEIYTYEKNLWGKETDNKFNVEIILDSINLENNTARIIANVGSGDLAVYPTSIGLMFIEQDVSAVHTLLIYYTTNKDNKNMFPATYDRNIQILGVPMNSNYYGFCKIFG